MIEGLEPYPEYKASGLSWAPQIPAHWSVVRNGRLFEQRNQTGFGDLPLLEVSLKTGVRVRSFDPGGGRKQRMADPTKYKRAVQGDVAYNMMRMWQGAVGIVPTDGLVSPAYVVARPFQATNPHYFVYLFRTSTYKQQINDASRGIVPDRNRLYWPDFKRLSSLCPTAQEQAAIVRFVKCLSDISEKLVRAKTQTLTLLTAEEHATIQRFLTSEISNSATPANCGFARLSWLGCIPSHWEIMSLRLRYRVELGKMLDSKRNTGTHAIPYLRNRDVQWGRILIDNLPTMDVSPDERARYTVEAGDLLVCEGGQVGRAAFWEGPIALCAYQKALHRVRCIDRCRDNARFLFYQLRLAAAKGVFSADGNESTIAHLTCEKFRRHRFAFPPIAEQNAIVKSLDAELSKIAAVKNQLTHEINLLREYRTRLVSDVVTGRLDVREAAAKLPAEIPLEPTEPEIEASEEEEAALA